MLQGPRIVAVVGQLEPAGMAEHVRVDRPRVAVGALRPIDRPAPIALPIAIMAKWRNRQIGANCWTLGEVAPLDCQVYDAWGAFLGCRFHAGKPCLRVSYCIAYTPFLNSQSNGEVKTARPNEGARTPRRLLAKGVGILKVAKSLGIGTGTVQRISGERAMSLRGAEQ